MTFEELNEMWVKDCKIDETILVRESSRTPELHSKYYNYFYREALRVRKLKADLVELEKAKTEYFNGSMDEIELKQRGWKPNPLKILRQDIQKYIESDREIINLSLRIAMHEENAKYLESIIRQINGRNFHIKNMLDTLKFQAGGY